MVCSRYFPTQEDVTAVSHAEFETMKRKTVGSRSSSILTSPEGSKMTL